MNTSDTFGESFNVRRRTDLPPSEIVLVGYNLRAADSRTIILSLAGYYQWDITELSVKAAGDVFYGTITAPKYKGTPPTENDC